MSNPSPYRIKVSVPSARTLSRLVDVLLFLVSEASSLQLLVKNESPVRMSFYFNDHEA